MIMPINVFLDTNILHKDYFFQNKSNAQLFRYMIDGLINIFMSDIVLMEMRSHYQLELEEVKTNIAKIKSDAERMKFKVKIEDEQAVVSILKRFDLSYEGLRIYKNFAILKFSNDMLTKIVKKAISKKPPFFNNEKKDQLKDCIIWLTYSQYAEKANLQNCFFITGNTNDFGDKESISKDHPEVKVHPELQNESKKFTIYRSAADFITTMAGEIERPIKEFREYIEALNIDAEYIKQQLVDYFSEQIEQELSITRAFNDEYQFVAKIDDAIGGGVNTHFFEIESVMDYGIQVLNQRALIFGKAHAYAEIDLSKRDFDPGCPTELNLEFDFNYDLLEDEECSNLEISEFGYLL